MNNPFLKNELFPMLTNVKPRYLELSTIHTISNDFIGFLSFKSIRLTKKNWFNKAHFLSETKTDVLKEVS